MNNQTKITNGAVLVTGAAGLVGTELTSQLLEKGEKVIALYNHKPITLPPNPNLIAVKCDILDTYQLEDIMENIKQVYHCAAIVSFDPQDRDKLFKTNIEGTASVVDACIAKGVEKLVHVSSVAAMGRIRNDEMINEEATWSEKTSNSAYAKSKFLGEMEVWRGVGEGLDAVMVNPSIIIGGNSWESGSSAIFKSAYNEFPWYTEGVSGFVSVKDVAKAMIALMNSDIKNERFILNGINTTYKDIFSLIAKYFNKKAPSKKVNKFLSAVIWRAEAVKSSFTGIKPLLTKETAATAQAKVYFDNNKILTYLPGFEFEPIEKTIKDTCEAMKINYKL